MPTIEVGFFQGREEPELATGEVVVEVPATLTDRTVLREGHLCRVAAPDLRDDLKLHVTGDGARRRPERVDR